MMVFTAEQAYELLDRYMGVEEFCFDVETRPGVGIPWTTADERKEASLDWRTNDVYWISFASQGMCDVVPLGHPHGEQVGWQPKALGPGQKSTRIKVPKWAPAPEQLTPYEFFAIIKPLFMNPNIRKANHNIKFDILSVSKYLGELMVGPFTDTLVQSHLINENRALDLGALVLSEIGFKYDKLGKVLETVSFSRAGSYSYYDAKYTWLLKKKNDRLIEEIGKTEYAGYLNDVTEVLVSMEWRGQPVVGEEVKDLDVVLTDAMLQAEHDLFSRAGRPFKLTANAEKGWFIYDVLKHKPVMFTKKKQERSTAEAAFKMYEDDPMVARLMEWDDYHKLHSTYVVNYSRLAYNGRLNPNYKQAGTVTGRFSAARPNLQNVPNPESSEVGRQIRHLFWGGSEDMCLVVADYSQIELRILAHFSADPTMLQAFEDDIDIHQATADTLGTVRKTAKAINFAIPYGAGYRRVAQQADVDVETAKAFFDQHREDFPAVWTWVDLTKRRARKQKEVLTLLGRSRRVPQITMPGNSDYANDMRARSERQAVNARIQGSAADLIGMAMIRIHDALPPQMYMTMQVHDEVVVVTPRDRAEECAAIVREAMLGEEMQMLRCKVDASIKVVERWSEAK
jgi:DNA polymerase-1